ncbi:cytochrome C oxidase subunit IV family protein [Fuscibacter oryzae]|uniref:Cytochrome C oxidase subunit IV family protein n=1 Tax=Fuscibacter oryzae TaxID=2803939 RepID=A0A8J7MSJ1_9RHOB|nr:cytochrome C oxidase subunit IV family protein [Fuscibacter oryzae]MBL4928751.1 cytochrome C oxidase subunit IV family protein [Fuscibacter oryzae]
MDRLTRTWALLIGLTLATTALAAWDGRLAVPGLMLLAWAKARGILAGFLHLRNAPGWLAAFTLPLALWLAAIAALMAIR